MTRQAQKEFLELLIGYPHKYLCYPLGITFLKDREVSIIGNFMETVKIPP
jgi:hypothetical protein